MDREPRVAPSEAETSSARPGAAALGALALLSTAVLLYELDLIRIFSFSLWHHFTFMVLSIALLGFGVSGVALQVWPRLGEPPRRQARRWMLVFAASAVLAVAAVSRIPLESTLVGREARQFGRLLAVYAILAIPFGAAGLSIASLIRGFPRRATAVYAADLGGASLGCLALAFVLPPLGAEGVVLLVAALGAAAAWLLGLSERARTRASHLWIVAVLLPLAALPWSTQLLPLRPGPGKALAVPAGGLRGGPAPREIYPEWHPLGRIDVVENLGTVRWLSNSRSPAPVPPQTNIVIDGDAMTPVVHSDGDPKKLPFLDYTLPSAGLQLARPEHVLVIGSGGGADVLASLRHGAKRVDAVEIHPTIVRLVTGQLAERSGHLFERPEVTLHRAEGRSFVTASSERYGAIVLSLIDTWAASASGAYSLAESYLYTVEAFEQYFEHLEDRGVLVITRWDWIPPRESLRLCTVAAQALRRLGVDDPARHVVVLSVTTTAGNMAQLIVQRSPLTDTDIAELRSLAASRGYYFLYAPGISGSNAFIDYFRAPDQERFIETYPFDIAPVTDDRPFFFQFGRWRDANPFGAGWRESPLVLSGRLVLLAVLLQAVVLSAALMIVPLLASRRSRAVGRSTPVVPRTAREAAPPQVAVSGAPSSTTLRSLGFFFLIGLSFMLLEVVLMQRFTLLLGSPVWATTVVLVGLLASAGLGSALGARLAPLGRPPRVLFASIVGLALLYATGLPALFQVALGASAAARVLLSLALVCPLGLLLGVPFPAGIVRVGRAEGDRTIGWLWAANGCASVIGPILAVLCAMDFGFTTVTLLGGLGYAAAYAVFGPLWRIGVSELKSGSSRA